MFIKYIKHKILVTFSAYRMKREVRDDKSQSQNMTSGEPENSLYIDMMLNPEKQNQYQMDVDKLERNIRAEEQTICCHICNKIDQLQL